MVKNFFSITGNERFVMTSGREINYALRPAKSIERKIMCEFFLKASELYSDISQYTYIGFGSFYFSDFALFHKRLRINKMYSIEKDSYHKARYDFNKPYHCITMKYASSSIVLNTIIKREESEKYFIWLDYDGYFTKSIIDDLKTCINKLSAGSYICISFSLGMGLDPKINLYDYIKEEAGNYISPELKIGDVCNKSIANIIWGVLQEVIKESIKSKNSAVDTADTDKYSIEQIMYFQYKDNVPMMTVCFMVARNKERQFLIDYDALKLDFYKKGNVSYDISVPQLTWLEVRKINTLLPSENEQQVIEGIPFIDPSDLQEYIKVYKYYPNYLEGQDTL